MAERNRVLGTRLTRETAHTCPPARHLCSVCGEPIFLTRKGGAGTLRWVHRDGRDHPARHHALGCRVPPRDTRRN